MKKITKYIISGIIVIAIFIFLVNYLTKPKYPDIVNEKPFLGNENATILIEEFSDFQCPFCKQASVVIKSIIATYGNNVKLRFINFPLTSIHQYAFKAAEAAECANDQGRFWEYHDALFRNQNDLSERNLKRIANELNLDIKNFSACLDSGAKSSIVENEIREGMRRGVRGTPTFFINGKQILDWRYESFKEAIEQEINATS